MALLPRTGNGQSSVTRAAFVSERKSFVSSRTPSESIPPLATEAPPELTPESFVRALDSERREFITKTHYISEITVSISRTDYTLPLFIPKVNVESYQALFKDACYETVGAGASGAFLGAVSGGFYGCYTGESSEKCLENVRQGAASGLVGGLAGGALKATHDHVYKKRDHNFKKTLARLSEEIHTGVDQTESTKLLKEWDIDSLLPWAYNLSDNDKRTFSYLKAATGIKFGSLEDRDCYECFINAGTYDNQLTWNKAVCLLKQGDLEGAKKTCRSLDKVTSLYCLRELLDRVRST